LDNSGAIWVQRMRHPKRREAAPPIRRVAQRLPAGI